jgi:hypothetical protein
VCVNVVGILCHLHTHYTGAGIKKGKGRGGELLYTQPSPRSLVLLLFLAAGSPLLSRRQRGVLQEIDDR